MQIYAILLRCGALHLPFIFRLPSGYQYSGALPLPQSFERKYQVQSTEIFIGNHCRIRAEGTAYRNECDLSRCSAPSFNFITSCFYQYSGGLPMGILFCGIPGAAHRKLYRIESNGENQKVQRTKTCADYLIIRMIVARCSEPEAFLH